MTVRGDATGGGYDRAVDRTYLLIHPEHYPSVDADAVTDGDDTLLAQLEAEVPWGVFDDRYGEEIARVAGACQRRVAVLDRDLLAELLEAAGQAEPDPLDTALLVGVPAAGWELIGANARDVARVLRRRFHDHRGEIVLAGYNRWDCVARVQRTLERLGIAVTLHEAGTLPLTALAARHYAPGVAVPAGRARASARRVVGVGL
jgi:hypothetical protein